MVHYTTAGKDTRLELVSYDETGIAALPADFYSRTMCLSNMFSKAVVASVSLYNPNTGRGSLEVRPLSWITSPPMKSKTMKKLSPVVPMIMPKVPVVQASTLSSPPSADQTALHDCVQAPPASAMAIRTAMTVELESTASNHTSPSSLLSLTPPGGIQLFSTDASIETPRKPAKKTLSMSMVPDSVPHASSASVRVPPGSTSEKPRHVEASSRMAQVSPEQKSSEKPPAEVAVKKGGAITKFLKQLRYGESAECHPKKTLESQFDKLTTSEVVPKKQKETKRLLHERNNVKVVSATENNGISKMPVSSFASSSSLKASTKISPSIPRKKLLDEIQLEREKMVKRQKKLKARRDEKVTPVVETSVQGVTPVEKVDTGSNSQLVVDQAPEKQQIVLKAAMKEADLSSVVSSDQKIVKRQKKLKVKRDEKVTPVEASVRGVTPVEKVDTASKSQLVVDQAPVKQPIVLKAAMKEADLSSVVSSDQNLDLREPLVDAEKPKTKKLLAKPGHFLAKPGQRVGPIQDLGRSFPPTTKGQVLEESQLEREKMVKRQKKLKIRKDEKVTPVEASVQAVTPMKKVDTAFKSQLVVDQAPVKQPIVPKAAMKEADLSSVVSSDQNLDLREPLVDAEKPKTKKLLAKPGHFLAKPGQRVGPIQDLGRSFPPTTKGQVLEESQLEREKMVKRQKKLKTRRLSKSTGSTLSIGGKPRQSAGNGAPVGVLKDGKVKAGNDNLRKYGSNTSVRSVGIYLTLFVRLSGFRCRCERVDWA